MPLVVFKKLILEAETITLLAAMDVQPDSTRRALINTSIIDLKAAGVWDKVGILCLTAAHDGQASRLNWKTGSIYLSLVGSPTFDVDLGWTGVTNNRFSGGELYTSSGGLFTYTTQHHACWVSNDAANPSNRFIYNQNNTSQYWMNPRGSTGNAGAEAGDQQSSQIAVADSLGWYIANWNNGGAAQGLYKDGSLLTTSFSGSRNGQSNRSLDVLSDAFSNASPHRLAAFSAGTVLTAQNLTDYYTIMLDYMQAVGAA